MWFCVASRVGWLDVRCVRFLGLYCGATWLLCANQDPLNSPLPNTTSGREIWLAIVFSRRSPSVRLDPIDLVVNVNFQVSTQTSQRGKVSRFNHQDIVVQLVPSIRRLSQQEYTRFCRMLMETQIFDWEFPKSLPPLLGLTSQAVSSSDFQEFVGVQAFL